MKRGLKSFLVILLALCMSFSGISGLKMNSVYAEEADAAGITVDGLLEDWYYIEPLYMGGGIINKVSAFTDNGMLYLKFEMANKNYDTWHIYFDTDGDNTNHLYFNGSDYMIETDWLYEYQGDTGEWEGNISIESDTLVAKSEDEKAIELSVSLEYLGNPETIGVNIATVDEWVDVALQPSLPNEYLTIPVLADVQKDTMVGLSAQEIEAIEASKQFYGKNGQWDSIDYNAVNMTSNLKSLKAVSDGEFLYVSVSAKRLSNNFTAYIAMEEDTAGCDRTSIWPDASDMSYQLKADGKLYKMKGNSKVDMGTLLTEFYKDDSGFEAKIPFEVLGTSGTSFGVAIEDEGECLPDEGSNVLKVTSPVMTQAPAITVDGSDTDWAGIEPIGTGEGTLGDLYAFRDNDNLYVMTYISGVTDPESSAAYTTSLFIDTDQKNDTGYLHSGYPLHSGGNFLVQDWYSYGENRNLEFFFTDSSVILPWNMKGQSAEGYEKVFEKTDKKGTYCAEWVVPISIMKDVTPGISDDLYICIDRDDCQTDEVTFEKMTPPGFTPATDAVNGAFAKVPKYQIKFTLDFKDFGFDDWNSVCNQAVHENAVNMCAVRTDDRLFSIVTAEGGLTTNDKYYIQTDTAGFKYDNYDNVSYIIDKASLYAVTADNTLANEAKTVYRYYSDSYALMNLYLADIGNPQTIKLSFNSNNGNLILPETDFLSVTKTLELEKEEGTYYPIENFDAYNNPFKGWMGWGDIVEGDMRTIVTDYNLVYVDIKWSELEPVKGEYAFEAIEEQYQFDYWRSLGKRMILRFVMDNPNLDETRNPDIKRMDIPEWLYNELEEENAEGEGAGVFYNGEAIIGMIGGVGFSPNYKSPKLLEYHANAVKAMAERYDDPSICAYVEVGSLGHWAEFHCWPSGTGEFPEPALAQQYMSPYQEYFKKVKIGIRKPYALAADNNWGLYNDIFGVADDAGTLTFLQWAESGNTDMPGSTPEDVAASCMPEWWKLNYSGGEFASGNYRLNALDENICAVLGQIRDSHTTWLGPCSACDIKVDDGDYPQFAYNTEVMLKTMGYRYNVYSVTKLDYAAPGTEVPIKIVWKNSGVAPLYYNWPVKLALVDESGKEVYSQILNTNTTEWLPGNTTVSETLKIPADLATGTYKLTTAICDPATNVPGINLAMEGKLDDGSYELYTFNVGEVPAEVTESPAEVTATPEPTATATETPTPAPDVETASSDDTEGGSNLGIIIAAIAAGIVLIGGAVYLYIKKKKK